MSKPYTLHFDLSVEVHEDGSATATLNDPGSFDIPLAERGGSTPELATQALFASVSFAEPTPVLECNGVKCSPGVMSGGSSSFGHYVGKHLVAEALSLGMHDEMAQGAVETYDEWYHREDWAHADHWQTIVDDAEEWLNQHTVGGMWWWHDGEFRLDRTEACHRCGEQRWSDPDWEDTDCREHMTRY
jgi:hypothetical protein